jgi:hypothetical protein
VGLDSAVGWDGCAGCGGGGEYGHEGVGLAASSAAGVSLAVFCLVGFGAGEDEGLEQFGTLAG